MKPTKSSQDKASHSEKASLNVRISRELKDELKRYAEQWGLTLEELSQTVFEDFLRKKLPIRKRFQVG